MDNLPIEIVDYLFSFLDEKSLRNTSNTCKQYNSIINEIYWRRVYTNLSASYNLNNRKNLGKCCYLLSFENTINRLIDQRDSEISIYEKTRPSRYIIMFNSLLACVLVSLPFILLLFPFIVLLIKMNIVLGIMYGVIVTLCNLIFLFYIDQKVKNNVFVKKYRGIKAICMKNFVIITYFKYLIKCLILLCKAYIKNRSLSKLYYNITYLKFTDDVITAETLV